MYSGLIVIRWRPSGKSRSQQEIKAIYPTTLRMICAVLISVMFCSSVIAGWPGSNRKFWSNPSLFVSNAPIITGTNLSFIIIIIIIITIIIIIIFIPCMTRPSFQAKKISLPHASPSLLLIIFRHTIPASLQITPSAPSSALLTSTSWHCFLSLTCRTFHIQNNLVQCSGYITSNRSIHTNIVERIVPPISPPSLRIRINQNTWNVGCRKLPPVAKRWQSNSESEQCSSCLWLLKICQHDSKIILF